MNDSKVQVGVKKVPIHLQSAQNRLLIKGGRVVNDDGVHDADVYIEDGVVKQVGSGLMTPGGVRVIEAAGMLVIPGGIDPHTRLQSTLHGTQSPDDFYTGTKAALAGGTTMIIDTVECPRGDSMLDWYAKYRAWADEKVCCDYGLRVCVPQWAGQKTAEEMAALVGAERGVNAFHCHMAHPAGCQLEDDELLAAFQACRRLGALAQVHAENGKVIERKAEQLIAQGIKGPEGYAYARPESLEVEATMRALSIADEANCPLYVLPVMSPEAADLIAAGKRRGQACFGEAIAAALVCDSASYQHASWRYAAGHVTSPPFRDAAAKEELARCLSSGRLACCASGHCSYKAEQKALGRDDFRRIPGGVNGLEDRMSVVWEACVETGLLDPCQFVAVTSTNAAKLFNLYPQKGRIAVGSDADIVVWNPSGSRTISAKSHQEAGDFSVFEGFACHGLAEYVVSAGRLVVDERQLRVTQGAGRFITMAPFAPLAYARIERREKTRAQSAWPVSRSAYEGPVVDVKSEQGSGQSRPSNPIAADDFGSHQRPPTRGGGRDMQESSFALSGAQIDDKKPTRSGIRTNQPPGGASSGSLW